MGIIIVSSVWLIVIIVLWFCSSILKRQAEQFTSSLNSLLINAGEWKVRLTAGSYNGMSLYNYGYFQNYLVTCRYGITNTIQKMVEISATPEKIPKVIPTFRLIDGYPIIYKNYFFDGYNVSTQIKLKDYGGKLSEEDSKQLLEDLVHACEMVERGEYEVK